MERESFEDPDIASLMNEHFVSIKVDREERPDIDSIYMGAVQAMTGQGGWPMTVFLTPEGKPFYGGTYFPPEERGGLPSFPRVLTTMADVYRNRRGDVVNTTNQLIAHMRQMTRSAPGIEPLTDDIIVEAARELRKQFDDKYGGFGLQPKFPQPMTLEFLLRHYLRSEDPSVLEMVDLTLDQMARGGIYDQLGEEGSTGTRPTRIGLSLISRRCSTTTLSWRDCISMRSRSPAVRCTGGSSRRRWTTSCGR